MSSADPAPPADLEVGGFGLLGAALIVLALCAGSFWLGRFTAQTGGPPASTGPASAPGEVEEGGDVSDDLTFFDRLEKAPELSAQGDERAALGTGTPGAEEPVAAPPASPVAAPTSSGPFLIQVLASAERAAAEAVLARLTAAGYPATLAAGEKDGRPIYRVRVGGYADEAEARRVAARIESQEGLRTWITR